MSVPDSRARRNLVVVRAGKNSLHPGWLSGEQARNWDLVVSLYDPDARFPHPDDVLVVARRGGKWDGLHALFANSDVTSRYDYIWLPDDDIATSASTINAIFDAMRRYHLDVAQPALTRDSYFSHFALMSCPGYLVRYSNFVETMAPCLKSGVLQAILADFEGSMSGFGLDYVWCRLSRDNRFKAAILDDVAVHHTRPVGRALRNLMDELGVSPEDEERRLFARYNLKGKTVPLVYAAIDRRQRRRAGPVRLGLAMAAAYLSVFAEFSAQQGAGRKIVQLVRLQVTRRIDLSQLRRRGQA